MQMPTMQSETVNAVIFLSDQAPCLCVRRQPRGHWSLAGPGRTQLSGFRTATGTPLDADTIRNDPSALIGTHPRLSGQHDTNGREPHIERIVGYGSRWVTTCDTAQDAPLVTTTITRSVTADGFVPQPTRVDHDGLIGGQVARKGAPLLVYGFATHPRAQELALPFSALSEDPGAVYGLCLVTMDWDGTISTLDGPIESVTS